MSVVSYDRVVAVDVDGVVIDTCQMWLKYLLGTYRLKDPYGYISKETLPYDLTKLFNIPEGQDGFDWWHQFDLYDNLAPRKDAIEYVAKLHEEGFKIIFVSTVIGYHHSSKVNFLEKWFPYNDGIILTHEKQYIQCNYLVDDCYKNLNKMDSKVYSIKFRSDFKEEVQPKTNFPVAYNWEQVYNEIVKVDKLRRVLR